MGSEDKQRSAIEVKVQRRYVDTTLDRLESRGEPKVRDGETSDPERDKYIRDKEEAINHAITTRYVMPFGAGVQGAAAGHFVASMWGALDEANRREEPPIPKPLMFAIAPEMPDEATRRELQKLAERYPWRANDGLESSGPKKARLEELTEAERANVVREMWWTKANDEVDDFVEKYGRAITPLSSRGVMREAMIQRHSLDGLKVAPPGPPQPAKVCKGQSWRLPGISGLVQVTSQKPLPDGRWGLTGVTSNAALLLHEETILAGEYVPEGMEREQVATPYTGTARFRGIPFRYFFHRFNTGRGASAHRFVCHIDDTLGLRAGDVGKLELMGKAKPITARMIDVPEPPSVPPGTTYLVFEVVDEKPLAELVRVGQTWNLGGEVVAVQNRMADDLWAVHNVTTGARGVVDGHTLVYGGERVGSVDRPPLFNTLVDPLPETIEVGQVWTVPDVTGRPTLVVVADHGDNGWERVVGFNDSNVVRFIHKTDLFKVGRYKGMVAPKDPPEREIHRAKPTTVEVGQCWAFDSSTTGKPIVACAVYSDKRSGLWTLRGISDGVGLGLVRRPEDVLKGDFVGAIAPPDLLLENPSDDASGGISKERFDAIVEARCKWFMEIDDELRAFQKHYLSADRAHPIPTYVETKPKSSELAAKTPWEERFALERVKDAASKPVEFSTDYAVRPKASPAWPAMRMAEVPPWAYPRAWQCAVLAMWEELHHEPTDPFTGRLAETLKGYQALRSKGVPHEQAMVAMMTETAAPADIARHAMSAYGRGLERPAPMMQRPRAR